MHDLAFFRNNLDAIAARLATRGFALNVDEFRTLDTERRAALSETENLVQGGFFGRTETKGLALPREVLEKIYWRNAARIYPRVKEVLTKLGYALDKTPTSGAG